MVKVFGIKPHHAGFGQFQCDVEGIEYQQFGSAEEYAAWAAAENRLVRTYATDPDIAEMGDEDGEKLAAAIREARGAVVGGHGAIVAFLVGDEVQLESVDVVNEELAK